jgi:hypothetical protein
MPPARVQIQLRRPEPFMVGSDRQTNQAYLDRTYSKNLSGVPGFGGRCIDCFGHNVSGEQR